MCNKLRNTVWFCHVWILFLSLMIYRRMSEHFTWGPCLCLAPLWQSLPSATNGFNPLKFVEVSQQEAEITRIMHMVCFWNRGKKVAGRLWQNSWGSRIVYGGTVKAAAGVKPLQRHANVRLWHKKVVWKGYSIQWKGLKSDFTRCRIN